MPKGWDDLLAGVAAAVGILGAMVGLAGLLDLFVR